MGIFATYPTRDELLKDVEDRSATITGTIIGHEGNRALVELDVRCLADAPVEVHLASRNVGYAAILWSKIIVARRDGRWVQP